MKRAILLLTLVGAMLLACTGVVLAQPNQPASSQQSEVVPDQYIVVLKDSVPKTRSEEKAKEAERDHDARVDHIYTEALKGFSAKIPANKVEKVKDDPDVKDVVEDRRVWAFVQELPKGIDRIDAESASSPGPSYDGSGMPGVAILDTGIDTSHPDLHVARTSSGSVDGKLCIGTSVNDGHGHGTHVAGTVAAKDDTNGVVGVAPGAKLYPVKVLNDSGGGTTSSIACGIDWVTGNAAAKGIKVANMSLGGSGQDDNNCGNTNGDVMHRAICNSVNNAGVTYVVAAGNSNADFAGFTPAAYNEVLTVTAIADGNGAPGGGTNPTCRTGETDDTPATFSNWTTSTNTVDQNHSIAAPGVCIRSTWKGGGYNTISGTSMASPHIAGAVVTGLANGAFTDTNGNGKIDPAEAATKLRADAAGQPTDYGYTYSGSNYYDKLAYAGGYRSNNSNVPAAPTIRLAAASDTGSSNTDKLTSDNTPTFEGTAGANNSVEIFDGGTTSVCTTTADASGNYSCTVTTALAHGTHSFTATATDTASSTSSSSTALSVDIDTRAPTVDDNSLNPASDAPGVPLNTSVSATFNEAMDSATVTNSTNPTFYLVDAADPTATPIAATVTYDAPRKATLTPSANLKPKTTYTATIKGGTGGAKDVAGNPLAADKSWSFTTASETVPVAPSNLQASRGGSGSNQKITLTWTDNSNNETGFKVERSTDNANWSQVAAPAANTTSYTDSGLSRGTTYYYRVKATNGAVDSAYSNTASAKTK